MNLNFNLSNEVLLGNQGKTNYVSSHAIKPRFTELHFSPRNNNNNNNTKAKIHDLLNELETNIFQNLFSINFNNICDNVTNIENVLCQIFSINHLLETLDKISYYYEIHKNKIKNKAKMILSILVKYGTEINMEIKKNELDIFTVKITLNRLYNFEKNKYAIETDFNMLCKNNYIEKLFSK